MSVTKISKKTIYEMLEKFRIYRRERREKYEEMYISILRKTNYDDTVTLPKPWHELTILNSQIELLELILKNSE